MKSNDTVLVALLVVLVIIVAYQGRRCWMKGDGFSSGGVRLSGGAPDPYGALNGQLDRIRGHKQPPRPSGFDRFQRSGAPLKPENFAEAEREQWYAATEADRSGGFNTELSQDAQTDTMQYHSAQPTIDYSGYITDLVVDPRTKDNHGRWVEEMKPWSGTAMAVDDMDEAMEATTHFTGLRRPQAIVQHNPLQLTESDTYTFASNAKFNFKG